MVFIEVAPNHQRNHAVMGNFVFCEAAGIAPVAQADNTIRHFDDFA